MLACLRVQSFQFASSRCVRPAPEEGEMAVGTGPIRCGSGDWCARISGQWRGRSAFRSACLPLVLAAPGSAVRPSSNASRV